MNVDWKEYYQCVRLSDNVFNSWISSFFVHWKTHWQFDFNSFYIHIIKCATWIIYEKKSYCTLSWFYSLAMLDLIQHFCDAYECEFMSTKIISLKSVLWKINLFCPSCHLLRALMLKWYYFIRIDILILIFLQT